MSRYLLLYLEEIDPSFRDFFGYFDPGCFFQRPFDAEAKIDVDLPFADHSVVPHRFLYILSTICYFFSKLITWTRGRAKSACRKDKVIRPMKKVNYKFESTVSFVPFVLTLYSWCLRNWLVLNCFEVKNWICSWMKETFDWEKMTIWVASDFLFPNYTFGKFFKLKHSFAFNYISWHVTFWLFFFRMENRFNNFQFNLLPKKNLISNSTASTKRTRSGRKRRIGCHLVNKIWNIKFATIMRLRILWGSKNNFTTQSHFKMCLARSKKWPNCRWKEIQLWLTEANKRKATKTH